MSDRDSEQKDVFDPSYGAADFPTQLSGGKLRWLASILAVASLGLFGFLLTEEKEAELDFPFHLKGRAAFCAVGIGFAVWFVIAVINWVSWFKKNRRVG
jgi:hypothetical protein